MEQLDKKFAEKGVDITGIANSFLLIGLLSEFDNRFQSKGDAFFKEISWRQCFVLICLNLLKEPPSIRELSEIMGTSHQNTKQLLLRLSKAEFVQMVADEKDHRKQRVIMTEKAKAFQRKYDEPSEEYMERLFEGVEPEALGITIDTITKLDENLKRM